MEQPYRENCSPFRAWRKAKGYSLAHCAGSLGMSAVALSRLERGKRVWQEPVVTKVYKFTEGAIDANALFGHGLPPESSGQPAEGGGSASTPLRAAECTDPVGQIDRDAGSVHGPHPADASNGCQREDVSREVA